MMVAVAAEFSTATLWGSGTLTYKKALTLATAATAAGSLASFNARLGRLFSRHWLSQWESRFISNWKNYFILVLDFADCGGLSSFGLFNY
jgi:hypothetical protein